MKRRGLTAGGGMVLGMLFGLAMGHMVLIGLLLRHRALRARYAAPRGRRRSFGQITDRAYPRTGADA